MGRPLEEEKPNRRKMINEVGRCNEEGRKGRGIRRIFLKGGIELKDDFKHRTPTEAL